jgi:hypothetical protein
MNNFIEHIFYNPDNKFYKEGKINTKSWTADNIKCFIKKYRKLYEDLFKETASINQLLQAREKDFTIDWFPEIFWDNKKDIAVFEYVGEPINSKNIPDDYQKQFDKIFSDLLSLGLMHNKIIEKNRYEGEFYDNNFFINSKKIYDSELTVKNNKIYLVDYCGHLKELNQSGEFEALAWDKDKERLYTKIVKVTEYKKEIDEFLDNLYKK